MNTESLSASIARRIKVQKRARKLWSFKPRIDRKTVNGNNAQNYSNVLACYLNSKERMMKILMANRVPPQDRDDILQEVVTLALDRGSVRNYESWMIATLRFQIIMYFRQNKKFKTRFTHLEPLQLDLAKETELRLAIESHIGWWHARLDIVKALRTLTPRMQWLIMMKASGYHDNEIGKATGYATQSIRKLYSRGIHALEIAMTTVF